MSVTAAELLVKVSAEGVKTAKDELKGVSDNAGSAGGKVGGFLSTMAGFVGGAAIVHLAGDAFGFLKGQVMDSWQAGMDANTVIAQTVAGLKSTNDASGMTAQSVGDLATKIMNLSGIDDDAVQTGENMLLTFTNIGKKVFPDATQAAADMATKMAGGAVPSAQQMQQASLLLGKALNDPTKGMTALQRVGVTLDAQQKAQIKTMQKHGDIAGAQGVILKELNKEFGGSAAAAGKANGGIAILTAQFNNMKESLGQQLIPIAGKFLSLLQPLASGLLSGIGSAIAGITPLFDSLSSAAQKLPLQPLILAFGRLQYMVAFTGQRIQTAALPILKQLGDFFTQHLLPAVTQFTGFAASTLVPMFGSIAVFVLQTVVPALIQLGGFVTDTLLPAVESLATFFYEHVLPVLEALVKVVVTDVLPTVESLAKTFLTKVLPPIERLIGLILPILIPAFKLIGWVISNVVGPVLGLLLDYLGWLIGKVADFVQGIETNLPAALSAVGNFFNNLGTKVHDLITTFTNAGHDIIQGLINGVTGMIGGAVSAVKNVGNNMLSGIKGMFGIHSPSTVFAELGKNLSQGLINGVTGVDVASPIGKHLSGAIPALTGGRVSVGMTGAALAGAGASYGAALAGAASGGASGGRGATQQIVIMLDRRTLASAVVSGMPDTIQVGTGLRG